MCIELIRNYDDVFYWKDKNECDFISRNFQAGDQAIQVCHTLTVTNRQRELTGLKSACNALSLKHGTIITLNQSEQFVYQKLEVQVLPLHEWLLSNNKLS